MSSTKLLLILNLSNLLTKFTDRVGPNTEPYGKQETSDPHADNFPFSTIIALFLILSPYDRFLGFAVHFLLSPLDKFYIKDSSTGATYFPMPGKSLKFFLNNHIFHY